MFKRIRLGDRDGKARTHRSLGLALALPLALGGLLLSRASWAQEQPRVEAEVPVTADVPRRLLGHNSPSIAVDPTDSRFVALAARIDTPDYGCTLHLSGDGGRGWIPANPIVRMPERVDKCYSPSLAFDPEGVLYHLFTGLAGPNNQPAGVFLTTSSDRGKIFTEPRRVLPGHSYMAQMKIDAADPTKGRIYVVWVDPANRPAPAGFASAPNRIMTVFSDDRGETFSEPVQANDASRERVVRPALALGAGQSLHVVYYDLGEDVRDFMGLEGPVWEEPWEIVAASSSDGGRSFDRQTVVDAGVIPPERIMLIFNAPPPAFASDAQGNLYAAWWDARNGDWDVFVRRSTDNGRTWEGAVRLNDDPPGNGRHQYLPGLDVAPSGRLDAVFYDRRSDVENVRNHVSYAYSRDAGKHFSPNLTLTTEPSDSRIGSTLPGVPSARGLFEYGSHPAVASQAGKALTAWTDTRWPADGIQQHIVANQVTFLDEAGAPRQQEDRVPALPFVLAGAAIVTAVGLASLFARARDRAGS